ncbi:MAG: acetate kinase [Candidatus Binatia bacterium]|nr:acetate kinase [Candidatus Binatia bacterium]
MRILVLNSGSSSLKFRLCEVTDEASPRVHPLLSGVIEPLGGPAVLRLSSTGAPPIRQERQVRDHTEAVQWLGTLLQVDQAQGSWSLGQIDAVGHRVVHGGERFQHAVRIDARVIEEIAQLSELAPLHNPACLAGIRAMRALLGESVPMVAVFDTAFHRTLPAHAATYAIPSALATRYQIRRYGFHGIAHASLADGYARATGRRGEDTRLITLQLGNGCSATAIHHGQSIDTSMGFTPLEGLMMGTRCGDLDPAVIPYLMRHTALPVATIERLLNEEAGLLGVSGLSHDMRTLLSAAERDARAALAIEMFCYRVRKYIGAYLAVLGGADAVIFGGGIGEHAPSIRARICAGMEWCGLWLDPDRNAAAVGLPAGSAARISGDEARLAAYVVAADEETWIARETVQCLRTTA